MSLRGCDVINLVLGCVVARRTLDVCVAKFDASCFGLGVKIGRRFTYCSWVCAGLILKSDLVHFKGWVSCMFSGTISSAYNSFVDQMASSKSSLVSFPHFLSHLTRNLRFACVKLELTRSRGEAGNFRIGTRRARGRDLMFDVSTSLKNDIHQESFNSLSCACVCAVAIRSVTLLVRETAWGR